MLEIYGSLTSNLTPWPQRATPGRMTSWLGRRGRISNSSRFVRLLWALVDSWFIKCWFCLVVVIPNFWIDVCVSKSTPHAPLALARRPMVASLFLDFFLPEQRGSHCVPQWLFWYYTTQETSQEVWVGRVEPKLGTNGTLTSLCGAMNCPGSGTVHPGRGAGERENCSACLCSLRRTDDLILACCWPLSKKGEGNRSSSNGTKCQSLPKKHSWAPTFVHTATT